MHCLCGNASSTLHASARKQLAPSQRQQRHRLGPLRAAQPESSSIPEFVPPHIYLGDGDAILLPKPRTEVGPRSDFDKEQALDVQLQVRPSVWHWQTSIINLATAHN